MITWAAIAVVVGGIVYLTCNKPETAKVAELGRLTFACGMLVLLLATQGHAAWPR